MLSRYLRRAALAFCLVFALTLTSTLAAGEKGLERLEKEVGALYKKVVPAIVGITVKTNRPARRPARRTPYGRRGAAAALKYNHSGSGSVISADGYIITSMDVVPADAKTITVYFTDGKKGRGKLVGYSKLNNVSLIKVERTGLKFLEMGDSAKVRTGQRAMTFGSPFSATMIDGSTIFSVGVVSSFYRAHDQGSYKGMAFETDATVAGGSDGGALVDSDGRLIGVLDLAHTNNKWLGLAVPINQVKLILGDMKAGKKIGPGFMGLKFTTSEGGGSVSVRAVKINSPAAKAGFKEGDVFISFCGVKIKNYKVLDDILNVLPPGTRFTSVIRRSGRTRKGARERVIFGTLDRNPKNIVERPKVKEKEYTGTLQPRKRTDTEKKEKAGFLGVMTARGKSKQGVLVERVMPGSPAAKAVKKSKPTGRAGIMKGDWIMEFAGKKVRSDEELDRVLAGCKAGKTYKVRIAREVAGDTWFQTFTVTLSENPKNYK